MDHAIDIPVLTANLAQKKLRLGLALFGFGAKLLQLGCGHGFVGPGQGQYIIQQARGEV